jgi:glycerol-3-phosphate acyltransferase PlsX
MKIAVDAMGGDFAPQTIVEGAFLAAKHHGMRVVLVGDEDQVGKELAKYPTSKLPLYVHHAPHVVAMHDSPSTVIRRMKDTSIKVAMDLAKEGQVDGVVTAGNSGAAMVILRNMEGVDRPAIATLHPTIREPSILIDSGGNVDCKPYHLVQFAIMGDVYARHVFGRKNPRIGVVSNGEEEGKGTDLTREAHEILKTTGLNYAGYVEGHGLNSGEVDVVVTDGFTGNVALKLSEGLGEMLKTLLQMEIRKSVRAKMGFALLRPAFENVLKRVDYSEYGGAPLLGINGNCVISHGASNGKAIKNAILLAVNMAKQRVNEVLRQNLLEKQDLLRMGLKKQERAREPGKTTP